MKHLLIIGIVCGLVTVGHADVISFYGDADGFGFGAPEVDHVDFFNDLHGHGTDYRGQDDLLNAPGTDMWCYLSDIGTWTHTYTLDAAPAAATLHLYLANFGWYPAPNGAVELQVDGMTIADLWWPYEPGLTHVVDIPVPLEFIDGQTDFEMVLPYSDMDGILDYARLTIVAGAAPEPGSVLSLGAMVAGMVLLRRR